MQPKLSIICSSFNQGHYFEKTITALNNQSYKNIELIIIDNFSSDNTIKLIKLLDVCVQFIQIECTAEYAYEEASRVASGKYLMWATTSDYLYGFDWIETAVEFLEENPLYSMVWTSSLNINEKGWPQSVSGLIYYLKSPPSDKRYIGYWLLSHYIPELNYIIRRSVFQTCISMHESINLTHRLLFNFTALGYQQKYIIGMGHAGRQHSNNLTTKNRKKDSRDIFKIAKLKITHILKLFIGSANNNLLDSNGEVFYIMNFQDKLIIILYFFYITTYQFVAKSFLFVLKRI
jgi:glycosyltransferase involved in cell wall biosynthesis